MTRPTGFPDLREGEYAVLCAEVETGIVLSLAGARAVRTDETYRIYSSAELASSKARELVSANPEWEAMVLDHEGRAIQTYRDLPGYERARAARKPPARWWTLWWRRWFGARR